MGFGHRRWSVARWKDAALIPQGQLAFETGWNDPMSSTVIDDFCRCGEKSADHGIKLMSGVGVAVDPRMRNATNICIATHPPNCADINRDFVQTAR